MARSASKSNTTLEIEFRVDSWIVVSQPAEETIYEMARSTRSVGATRLDQFAKLIG
jgi:hypothetical protein